MYLLAAALSGRRQTADVVGDLLLFARDLLGAAERLVDVTFGAAATLITDKVMAKVTLSPMSNLAFPVFNLTGPENVKVSGFGCAAPMKNP